MVAALRSAAGASRRLLTGALQRQFQLLASVPLMIEYEAVLTRKEHLKAAGLKENDVKELLDAVAAVSEPVVPNFRWRPMLRDANDDMVFEAAINGDADLLVTFNRRDFGAASVGKVRIVSPGEALMLLEEGHEKK